MALVRISRMAAYRSPGFFAAVVRPPLGSNRAHVPMRNDGILQIVVTRPEQ